MFMQIFVEFVDRLNYFCLILKCQLSQNGRSLCNIYFRFEICAVFLFTFLTLFNCLQKFSQVQRWFIWTKIESVICLIILQIVKVYYFLKRVYLI